MSNRPYRVPGILILFLILMGPLPSLLTGCSGKSIDESDPAALYKEAEEDVKSDRFQLALDKLRIIKNKFPYSSVATDAQLRIADVHYLQEAWPEAAAAYETFRDLHPKHDKVSYAMFRVGKSYFKDVPNPISRDLTPAQKAVDAFNDFLKKFPQTPEAAEAREELGKARKTLAEKELYIGNFYFKRTFYDSAKPRYEKVIELYPESDVATEAKAKLASTQQKIEELKKKEEPSKDGTPQYRR